MRDSSRKAECLREIKITREYTKYAEGSVLIEAGNTKVLCNASISNDVPFFVKGKGGWVTAEYSMLPRSTHVRSVRESSKGKIGGRSHEIQRLIGRSLRSAVDLSGLGEKTIIIDADVIQADGGTRTVAITGSFVSMYDAVKKLIAAGEIKQNPVKDFVAAVSAGIVQDVEMLDLDYEEDSMAQVDMNVVMDGRGRFIEVQSTAEKKSFTDDNLSSLLSMARKGIAELISAQKKALGKE